MSIPTFSEQRSAAIQVGLERVVDHREAPSRRRLPWVGVTAIALASALAGGALSTAVAGGLNPPISTVSPITNPDGTVQSGNPGVPAPTGVQPGAPIISLLGTSVSQAVNGSQEIQLSPPEGATHARVTLNCTTAGTLSWGLDAGGNNPSSTCYSSDVGQSQSQMDFDLSNGNILYVAAADEAQAIVTVQFINQVETAWGVNSRGETFGATKPGFGEPNLVAVVATNGQAGYVNAEELAEADGSAAAETFDSPEDALEWQDSMRGQSIDIPVYESDGTTVVGEFVIQH